MAHQLQSPLQSVLNFRDVGEFVNQTTQTKCLKTGLLYRSARPGQFCFNAFRKYNIDSA